MVSLTDRGKQSSNSPELGSSTTEGPTLACDGRRLLAALTAAATWLDAHRATIDALNVFPVPDGDTGTNMSMTLNAALREARESPAHEVGVIAERAAYGALMGARGNSGVILSQLLRGFARALRERTQLTPRDLAEAVAAAAETAGRAVMKPVEGTILTVANAAAREAEAALERGDAVLAMLDAILAETQAAVARTPDQLPVLKQAGVVDSGAQGFAMIVEGVVRFLHGQPLTLSSNEGIRPVPQAHVAHYGDEYGYCTEFVVIGPDLDTTAIRDAMATLGDSTLVVGEEGIVRVHIHTEDPGKVLSYAAPLGRLHKIKIENMQSQHEYFVAQNTSTSEPAPATPVLSLMPAVVGQVGTVAVAPGEGLAEVFRSLGVGSMVSGGQTMNPSTQDLLAAINNLPQDEVIILPNNSNILLVSSQARTLSPKMVTVIPTRTVPQGIAAMLAYQPEADLATNAAAMAAAAGAVRTGEITVAVRDAVMGELIVRAGNVLGLIDDVVALVGTDRDETTLDLIAHLGGNGGEIVTLYFGQEVTMSEAEELAERIRRRYPGLAVDVVPGGQPHYPYILSME